MQGAAKRVRMTYKDLLKLPDDGLRHELIDGEHYVTPSPVPRHQLIAGNLYLIIGNYVRERGSGVIAFDVVFTPYDVVVPDLLYFTTQHYREIARRRTPRDRRTCSLRSSRQARAAETKGSNARSTSERA